MKNQRHESIVPPNPAEIEYKHARLLMNAQETGYPVTYKGLSYFIAAFHRCDDPASSGLKTYLYLRGLPDHVPANEVTITERPQ